MSSNQNFACVSFTEENNCIEVVPSKWLCENNKKCFWPIKPGPNLQRLLSNNKDIDNAANYVKWKVEVLKAGK